MGNVYSTPQHLLDVTNRAVDEHQSVRRRNRRLYNLFEGRSKLSRRKVAGPFDLLHHLLALPASPALLAEVALQGHDGGGGDEPKSRDAEEKAVPVIHTSVALNRHGCAEDDEYDDLRGMPKCRRKIVLKWPARKRGKRRRVRVGQLLGLIV